jgi:hypothetical protein
MGMLLFALLDRSHQKDTAALSKIFARREDDLEQYICVRWYVANFIDLPGAWHNAAERLSGAAFYCFEVGSGAHAHLLLDMAGLAAIRGEMRSKENPDD